MPLRLRLTLFFTLFLAFVLIGVSATVYFLTQRSLVGNLEERAFQAVAQINSSGLVSGVKTLPRDAYFEVRVYLANLPASVEEVRNAALISTARRANPNPMVGYFSSLLSDEVYRDLLENRFTFARAQLENGTELLVLATLASVRLDEEMERDVRPQPAALFVGLPLPTERLAQLRRLLLYTSLSAFAVFALGVYILSRQVLLPVKKVTKGGGAGERGRAVAARARAPFARRGAGDGGHAKPYAG